MVVDTQRTIAFTGLRSGVGVATWGQRAHWRFMELMAPATEYFNIVQGVWVPHGLRLEDVLDAIRELVTRHESLRTRFHRDERGELLQELLSTDELVVDLCEAAGEDQDALIAELERRLDATRFDLTADGPIRALVATAAGVPWGVMFVVSHMAADLLSARIVRDELATLLAAQADKRAFPPPAEARQPLEQASHERSERGRRTAARSLAHWRSQLETVPRTTFAADPHPPEEVRYWRGTLTSRAIALACNVLARQYRTSTSTVLLAGAAAVLSRQTGSSPSCAFMLLAGNRLAPELRHAVGNLVQHVLATIDVSGPSFEDVVRSAWSASMGAYRHGQYDLSRLEALEADVNFERGINLDLTCFFNDLRPDTLPEPASSADAGPDAIRQAMAETEFRWGQPWHREDRKLELRVNGEHGRVVLYVLADTCFLPPPAARALVEGIERLLVEVATSGVGLDAAEALRVIEPPPRSDGWAHIDSCWVDLEAVERLLHDAVDLHTVDVLVEPGPDGTPALVAYVVPRDPGLTPDAIHRACMSLLPGRQTAMAPHRYVLCAHAPAAPCNAEAWRGQPIDAAGTGRPSSGAASPG